MAYIHLQTAMYYARAFAIGRICIPGRHVLMPAYARAMDAIAAAGFPQGHKQIDRLIDLAVILRQRRPRHIVEMGSGLSTVAFARYARRAKAALTSFEESAAWQKITRDALRAAGLTGHEPTVCERIEEGPTIRYRAKMPATCDFLYIDGPSALLSDASAGACTDTLQAWESGVFPATIAIDGRYATVDRLLQHHAARRYCWTFGWRYATEEKRDPSLPHRTGRHTLAVLRN